MISPPSPPAKTRHRIVAAEDHTLGLLRLRASEAEEPLRFAAISDLTRGVSSLVTVLAVWEDGSALTEQELAAWRTAASPVAGSPGYGVEMVTGSRDEALDPETTVERLVLLATLFPDEVRANPAMPLLRLTHPGLFDDLPP